MKIDYTVDEVNLKVLFLHTRKAYGNITFQNWVSEVKEAYKNFIQGKKDFKTFSQWIEGQINVL